MDKKPFEFKRKHSEITSDQITENQVSLNGQEVVVDYHPAELEKELATFTARMLEAMRLLQEGKKK